MKNGNLGGLLGGLVGIAVSVFVVGYAWRMSQSRKSDFIPGESSEPGAAPPLQSDLRKPFIDKMPRVNQGMTPEQLRQQDLAMQAKLDDLRKGNTQSDNRNADGFFGGVYN